MAKTITLTQDLTDETADVYLYPNEDLSGCTALLYHGDSPNYPCINENKDVPDEDETYVYWNTPSTVFDLYNLPNKHNLGTINYVQVYTRAKSADDAQHVDGIYKIICSPDSVCTHVYKSDNIGLVTTYKNYFKVWTENPATDTTWTWDNINDLAIGEECSSPTIGVQTLYTTLRPNAAGTYAQLNISGCDANYKCVDEVNKDDDTTYVYSDSSAGYKDDSYNLENHTTETGTIKSVTVYAWIRRLKYTGSSYGAYLSMRIGGNSYYSNYFTPTSTSYTLYSWTKTTNPNGGGAWTWANVDSLEAGLKFALVPDDEQLRATQLYVIVEYEEDINPEIRTTQCYAKINYNPADKECKLNCPEHVSTSHTRNIKMMNMWNGNREVYDLNRSGKSMMLQGKEIDYRAESVFYFDGYDAGGEEWTNDPQKMVDGNLNTCAYENAAADVQLLTSNTCSEVSGTVPKKIEIRAYMKYDVAPPGIAILRPVFNAGDGSSFNIKSQITTSWAWTDWIDITNDVNAPTVWSWNDVSILDCDVEVNSPPIIGAKTSCARVEIRVTDSGQAKERIMCVRDMGINGADVEIDDFSFCAFNGKFKIRSFGWDKISEKPIVYKWYLELEYAEL